MELLNGSKKNNSNQAAPRRTNLFTSNINAEGTV